MPHMMEDLFSAKIEQKIYECIRENLENSENSQLLEMIKSVDDYSFPRKILFYISKYEHFEYMEAKAIINEREVTY